MNKNMLAKEVAVSEKVTLSTAFKTVDGVLRVIAETLEPRAKGIHFVASALSLSLISLNVR